MSPLKKPQAQASPILAVLWTARQEGNLSLFCFSVACLSFRLWLSSYMDLHSFCPLTITTLSMEGEV